MFEDHIIPFMCIHNFIELYCDTMKWIYLLPGMVLQVFKNMPYDCLLKYAKTLVS